MIDLGLIEIKDRVRKDQSGCMSNVPHSTSNVPPSTSNVRPLNTSPKSPSNCSTTKVIKSRKLLSPLVTRRRSHPCTKWKVNKVGEIVNRLKGNNKKPAMSGLLEIRFQLVRNPVYEKFPAVRGVR